jgi:hypothetical protein
MVYSKYSSRAVSLLVFLPLMLTAQSVRENVVPLKNWATPLYWHPNQAERAAAAKGLPQNALPQLQFSTNAASADALTFVAITPCRLVDTRGAGGNFNGDTPFSGPPVAPATFATFPVLSPTEANDDSTPAPCGVIPSTAEAYSLNLGVIPQGGMAVNYVTIWPAGATQPVVATLGDQQGVIMGNAAIVAAGTPMGGVSVYNSGPAIIDVIIDMNGYFAAPTDLNGNTAVGAGTLATNTGNGNTATGSDALFGNTTGAENTASGNTALANNTSGNYNTASGAFALGSNNGSFNTASGAGALQVNTTGSNNTAIGFNALDANTIGGDNTASGYNSLEANTIGTDNTTIGFNALDTNTTGNFNIAIGSGAAVNAPPINSNSIYIASAGTPTDAPGTIQIGTLNTQTSFFVAGVFGVMTGDADAVAVLVDSNGQLGTTASSERFKEDIQDMGDASSDLLSLRPVTFRYKQAYKDGSTPRDYGLIAEEVAQIYPELVVRGKDRQIQTVQYQKLTPMLLNELQKQAEQIHSLDDRLAALEAGLPNASPNGSPNGLAAAPEPVR